MPFITPLEVTIAATVTAPIVAVGGTILGGWVQSRRDDRRWDREREQERERWERDDKLRREQWRHEAAEKATERWAVERRAAHGRLLATAQEWIDSAKPNAEITVVPLDPNDLQEREREVRAALPDVEAFASDRAVVIARRLLELIRRGSYESWILDVESSWEPNRTVDLKQALAATIEDVQLARDDYLTASRIDLGTNTGWLDAPNDGGPQDSGTEL